MVVRRAGNGFRQTLAELALQESHHLAHPLQGEAAAAQFADDRHLGQIFDRVQATMPFAGGNDDTALVPPLQLAEGDAGQGHHFAGCELRLHSESGNCFKHSDIKCLTHFRRELAAVNGRFGREVY